jgi:transposase-like protein
MNAKTQSPRPPRRPLATRKWDDPALLEAARKAILTGQTSESVAKRFGVNPTTAARAFIFAQGQMTPVGDAPQRALRSRNWDGKTNPGRLRELREQRNIDAENFLEIMKMQAVIYKLCAQLENFRIQDCPLEEVALWRISDLLDDLISLGTWADRSISAVQGWLGDADVRAKIEQLRDVRGRTPEEAENFLRRAAKLERQLGNRLATRA